VISDADSECAGKTEIFRYRGNALNQEPPKIEVAVLTGGADRPYAFGLSTAIMAKGAVLDLIGNDELECPEFHGSPAVSFLNLRGDQQPNASFMRKVFRVLAYYVKLIRYATTARPSIFHILWNNKFESFDRTLLTQYYKLLGKRIVITAHNVNAGRRDSTDSPFNRLTLKIQYRLADHIFVHTVKMRRELIDEFGTPGSRVSVIPFGINNAVPNTQLTPSEAKQRLGVRPNEKVLLFFGNIAPYKGLEQLVAAFRSLAADHDDYRLIIAGRPKHCEKYWAAIREDIRDDVETGRIRLRPDYIPDDETEVYFKGADVLVLPYREIYQSGVLFLGHSFGLPVLASDVGSLKEDIVEGKTGFVFKPDDPAHLARVVERYFASDLYADLDNRRRQIRDYVTERHSWDLVAQETMRVYANLLQWPSTWSGLNREEPSAAHLGTKTLQD